MTKPLRDGWIKWTGVGEPPTGLVDIRLRRGMEFARQQSWAFNWNHELEDARNEIVAYRRLTEETQPSPTPVNITPHCLIVWLQSWWTLSEAERADRHKTFGPDVAHLMRGVADMIEQSNAALADGCPCTVPGTIPCSTACSCVNPLLSGGCLRCAKYGSLEQRQRRAQHIAERLQQNAAPTMDRISEVFARATSPELYAAYQQNNAAPTTQTESTEARLKSPLSSVNSGQAASLNSRAPESTGPGMDAASQPEGTRQEHAAPTEHVNEPPGRQEATQSQTAAAAQPDVRASASPVGPLHPDAEGWHYGHDPSNEGDGRKLVTLEQDGMVWVGIRHWQPTLGRWVNNGEPTTEKVIAWQDLPLPARHRFVRGLLT